MGVREGQEKYFAVIGSKAGKGKLANIKDREVGKKGQVKVGQDWFDVAEIGEDNNIRVGVGSWLGYTKEALQQKVTSFYQMQLIDQSTALRLMEFGDIDEIIQQTRIEAMLKKSQTTPSQPGQPDQLSLATEENNMLLEGKAMPVSEMDDHLVHIAIHQDALGRGADEIVGTHIGKHQIMAGHSTTAPVATPQGNQMQDMMQTPPVAGQPQPGDGSNSQPGVANQPNPVGAPPGQNLPQQNIEQAISQMSQ